MDPITHLNQPASHPASFSSWACKFAVSGVAAAAGRRIWADQGTVT